MSKLLFLVFVLITIVSNAQNYSFFIKFTDGNLNQYSLTEVNKITFTSDNEMVLLETDGTLNTWGLNQIEKYYYQDISTNIQNEHIAIEGNIYPNPVTNTLNIENINGINNINILNNIGVSVFTKNNISLTKYSVDVNHLKSGVYYIQISSLNNNQVLKFVKN